MRYRWGGQYPGVNMTQQNECIGIVWPIVSIVFRNLSHTLACRAGFPFHPAPVLAFRKSFILILGNDQPSLLGHLSLHMAVDVPGLIGSIAGSLAIRTRVHADFLSADGAVIRTVARTNRTTHYTRVSLRTDQIIHATNPQKAARMNEKMSLSRIDIIVQHNEHIANIPAKIVSITQPAKPMAFIKALDTIVFIFLVLEFTPSLCVRRGCDRSVNYRPALRASNPNYVAVACYAFKLSFIVRTNHP